MALLAAEVRHARTTPIGWRDGGLALAAGLGVWATHFSAMTAYRPDLFLTYAPGRTAISAAVGVLMVGLPIAALARVERRGRRIVLATVAGIGIWCMHAVGLSALMDCGHHFSLTTNLIGGLIGTAILIAWQIRRSPRFSRLATSLSFVGAVCAIHFISLAGDGVTAPLAMINGSAMSPGLVAACTAFAVSVACLGGVLSVSQARLRREREAQTLKAVIESMSDGLVFIDRAGRLRQFNRHFLTLFDTPPEALRTGVTIDVFLDTIARYRNWHPDKRTLVGQAMKAWVHSDGPFDRECEMEDGRTYVMQSRPVIGQGVVLTFNDVTAERQASRKLSYHAHHDALTDLGNRRALRERKAAMIDKAETFSLLLIDLDEFKQVNDTFGHGIGDKLLIHCAAVLCRLVGPDSFVARMGGDEMAIVLTLPIGPATEFAQTVVNQMSEAVTIDGYRLLPGCSIGVAEWVPGLSGEELMKRADLALYDAKHAGRRRAHCYEHGMTEALLRRQEIVDGLHDAINGGGFRLAFQPIADLTSGMTCGYEALLRWQHPVQGWIAPDVFIPIAEDAGLIEEIGRWVIAEACRHLAGWSTHLYVAVNVSAAQLASDALLDHLAQAVVANGLPPERLEIEITETALIRDPAAVAGRLERIRKLGFKIALDDFGTGQSSLSHLRDLCFDRIKIDRSFVLRAASDPRSMAVLRATAALGRELGVITHAEGVETIEQIDLCRQIGCDAVQGYYIGRPLIPLVDMGTPHYVDADMARWPRILTS
ncbi:bifunctional diguanylate cyclase/phosphodiesterase [Sphingomonas fuzhouensis]|uniref:bifunctional diguanylate cyclase/phosphodiesterase n=1 Tax=Sphingomonas fuzhouensis TaxID=3106033 RepID=UPI002AFF91BC|nr:EAL domain-containing protein [Sphingomonas sp. SGZ-02]